MSIVFSGRRLSGDCVKCSMRGEFSSSSSPCVSASSIRIRGAMQSPAQNAAGRMPLQQPMHQRPLGQAWPWSGVLSTGGAGCAWVRESVRHSHARSSRIVFAGALAALACVSLCNRVYRAYCTQRAVYCTRYTCTESLKRDQQWSNSMNYYVAFPLRQPG